MFIVTAPVVPPPDKPVPAITSLISPGKGEPLLCNVPTKFTPPL